MTERTTEPIRHPVLRRIGLGISVALLLGALLVLWRQRDTVIDALAAIAPPAPLPLAMLFGAVFANLVLSGVLFSLLMSRYGTVGRVEMQALIAATTLVNFLPLRPGLFGRVAYHKSVNGIAVTDSAKAIMQGAIVSVIVAAYAALVALLSMQFNLPLWWGVLAPALLCTVLCASAQMRLWSVIVLVRYTEVLVWAVRYYAAFSLLGLDISWDSALGFSCVSVIATMVPLVSNGLGLREWSIGLLSPVLTSHALSLGLTAELINRAAELLVVTAAGLLGMTYLARRTRTISLQRVE